MFFLFLLKIHYFLWLHFFIQHFLLFVLIASYHFFSKIFLFFLFLVVFRNVNIIFFYLFFYFFLFFTLSHLWDLLVITITFMRHFLFTCWSIFLLTWSIRYIIYYSKRIKLILIFNELIFVILLNCCLFISFTNWFTLDISSSPSSSSLKIITFYYFFRGYILLIS